MPETQLERPATALTEDAVGQMIALAERLQEANGGVLDDATILAISEATGAPSEYVRVAVKLRADKQKQSFFGSLRSQYLTLEPSVRKYVLSGMFSLVCAASGLFELMANREGNQSYGLAGMLGLVVLSGQLYNMATAKDTRTAVISGAIFGGGFLALQSVICFALRLPISISPFALIPVTVGGAAAGFFIERLVSRFRGQLGLKDPIQERQEMLKQLVSLQDRLKSNEQHYTFLSLDIVGSTRMKELADPLSVEFTFNEYHAFVDRVTVKYGGRVHSTAGDGIISVFDHPLQAYGAARNVQIGLIELNTHANRIGTPIVLRAAMHTGAVMTAEGGDVKSVNFAHVIDIAAHLQKLSPPGGIAVSDEAAAYLPGGPTSIGRDRIQASQVFATIWQPRVGTAPPDAAPPSLQEAT